MSKRAASMTITRSLVSSFILIFLILMKIRRETEAIKNLKDVNTDGFIDEMPILMNIKSLPNSIARKKIVSK